jgi:hypothetical protein
VSSLSSCFGHEGQGSSKPIWVEKGLGGWTASLLESTKYISERAVDVKGKLVRRGREQMREGFPARDDLQKSPAFVLESRARGVKVSYTV